MTSPKGNVASIAGDNRSQPRPQSPIHNGRWAGYRHLLRARILELKREPQIIFWIFVLPVLLAVGVGVAFRGLPEHATSVVVIDGPGAQKTLPLLNRSNQISVSNSAIRAIVLDRKAALEALHLGKFDLAIESNPNGSYTYYCDPTRPESMLSRAEVDNALQSAAGRKDVLATASQSSNEPGSRYIEFLIPGLVGMSLMDSGMWGVGFALAEMRQRKLLKRLLATPMHRRDFVLSLISSRLVLNVMEVGLLLGVGVLVFHLQLRGALAALLLIIALGAMTFGGVGLFAAARAQKIESVSGIINLVTLPMWLVSGVFFPYQRFPAVAQPFIKALPLSALNDALRATMIQGASLASQTGRLLILTVWGIVSFTFALRWLRWL